MTNNWSVIPKFGNLLGLEIFTILLYIIEESECLHIYIYIYIYCVCVCVREKEREREREKYTVVEGNRKGFVQDIHKL